MSMENFPSRENKSEMPTFSMEEWKKFSGGASSVSLDSKEQQDWMAEKGIQFDKGIIEVEIDGKKTKMQTSKEDFGTWVDEENQ